MTFPRHNLGLHIEDAGPPSHMDSLSGSPTPRRSQDLHEIIAAASSGCDSLRADPRSEPLSRRRLIHSF